MRTLRVYRSAVLNAIAVSLRTVGLHVHHRSPRPVTCPLPCAKLDPCYDLGYCMNTAAIGSLGVLLHNKEVGPLTINKYTFPVMVMVASERTVLCLSSCAFSVQIGCMFWCNVDHTIYPFLGDTT